MIQLEAAFLMFLKRKSGRRFMVDRLYLTVDACDELIKAFMNAKMIEAKSIEVILLSDGVNDLPERLDRLLPNLDRNKRQSVLNIIGNLRLELVESNSTINNCKITKRFIGRSEQDTFNSICALAAADVVITSSGFSKILSEISRAQIIWAKDAVRYLGKERKLYEYFSGCWSNFIAFNFTF